MPPLLARTGLPIPSTSMRMMNRDSGHGSTGRRRARPRQVPADIPPHGAVGRLNTSVTVEGSGPAGADRSADDRFARPEALPVVIEAPETFAYRVKCRLLGSAAHQRRAQGRAAEQADGVGRPLQRLHLVLGVRLRGDPARPHPAVRPVRLHAAAADDRDRARRPRPRDAHLPLGGHDLHRRRRLVRRGPRELRAGRRAGRGGRPDARLHRHRRGAGVGGHGRRDECDPGAQRLPARDHRRRGPRPLLRQPARAPGGRPPVRVPDLLLRRLHGASSSSAGWSARSSATCRTTTRRPRSGRSPSARAARC